MPKYEIGYILSSAVADDQVSGVAAEIAKGIEASGGKILNEDHWGRRKLAYPIGRTRNGYYVFVTADVESKKISEIEHKLLTTESVIRFMIVNTIDADKRKAKDEQIRLARPQMASRPTEPAAPTNANIDEEIDKALEKEGERV